MAERKSDKTTPAAFNLLNIDPKVLSSFVTQPQQAAIAPQLFALDPKVLGNLLLKDTLPASSTPKPVAPVPSIPAPAISNALNDLPFPNAGDRIKSDHFRALSQSLTVIAESYALASALFGRRFSEARAILASQQYQIERVISVYGTELAGSEDATLDSRVVLQVQPVTLGERRIQIVLSEVGETRRFAPNLLGMSYADALNTLRTVLGDAAVSGPTITTPNLVNQSLSEAAESVTERE